MDKMPENAERNVIQTAKSNASRNGEIALSGTDFSPVKTGTSHLFVFDVKEWWRQFGPDLVGYIVLFAIAFLCILTAIVLQFLGC